MKTTDNKNLDLSRIYDELARLCEEAGTNLTQVCRDADVNRSILERWKKETPKSIEILARLLQAIEKASSEKKIIVPERGAEKVTRNGGN